MEKIELPFISAIRDFDASKSVFHGGELLVVGDAFAQCRPHGAGGTSQAALQAMLLAKVWNNEMTLVESEKTCLQSSKKFRSVQLGVGAVFMAR